MKKFSLIFTMVLIASVGFAQLTGSGHDFSGLGWNTATTNKICGPCHTPHNANTTIAEAPLWSHAITAVASYTVYGGTSTLDATVGQPGGISKLCLSCHDGTVALDNFIPVNGTSTPLTGTALLGTDLSGDHPISFTYDAALATTDGELYDPTTTASGLGGNIDADMLFGGTSDQMECASCHDVHNTAGVAPLLLKANTNSELCLTCHIK